MLRRKEEQVQNDTKQWIVKSFYFSNKIIVSKVLPKTGPLDTPAG